ncbi:MAG: Holliday junction DNA helicase RuvA [Proteobacteria bacterium]|nr:Holliday junction DNA helicase RuvA [Pseudomonadota bacterium]MBU1581907.1 Holliday junction DNA helicase RuvA [Pseudomonadota bacterium]MBU2455719.1 Holliday junction DNA helicase RuvA [Pseudomonadota bacterium]MBU2628159.1 Holliday junction DNA helicase RuvA [Pseudomonadota bacterium]
MIGYLEGTILHFESDGILLLAGNIGYEVLLNPQMVEKVMSKASSKEVISLYIYYHLTERQPKPVLIGFETLEEKEFFQTFITVDAIGPMKAVKAMTRPSSEIAMAIEKKDVAFLTGLSGIGKRTAEKIIATLHGKVEKFLTLSSNKIEIDTIPLSVEMGNIGLQVEDVLVEQLGHSHSSAKRLVKEAFERNSTISTPEDLFDEIFQEKR